MNKPKTLLIELGWLLLSALITVLIFALFFGKAIFQKTIDINLHDSYFVTQSSPLYVTLFIIIGFIIYYVKESKRNFVRKTQNIIILIFGLSLIIALIRMGSVVSTFKGMETAYISQHQNESIAKGWTVHPPQTNLKKPEPQSTASLYNATEYSMILVKVIIVSLLLNLSYKWGKSQKIDQQMQNNG